MWSLMDAQLELNLIWILRSELVRRRPGVWAQDVDVAVSQRQESDSPEVISGVYGGKTLGTPICILVRNLDQRSSDYDAIEKCPRRAR